MLISPSNFLNHNISVRSFFNSQNSAYALDSATTLVLFLTPPSYQVSAYKGKTPSY